MRINILTLLAALPLLTASCSAPESQQAENGTIRVTIGSGPRIDIGNQTLSRTELGDDDGSSVTVKWSADDRIALWAINGSGTAVLDAHEFALYHYNTSFDDAKFTADIPEMAEDTYTYCAVSPTPVQTRGTQASFDILSEQDGTFNGDMDVMVAAPVESGALSAGDNSKAVSLAFSHKVHVLKIRIPSNQLNESITKMQITFPVAVVGRLTVDAANPDAAPTLDNSSNTLTLKFDTPKDVGDVVYAIIAPVNISADQSISIKTTGQTCETAENYFPGKDFAAGHTTPIAYNIPVKWRDFTRLTFALPTDKGTATLGEKVTKIKLTAPTESRFDNESNVLEFTPGTDGNYTIMFTPSWSDNLSGKTVSVIYESESAIVSNTVVMPQIVAYSTANKASLSVPYLMTEDFSGCSDFSGPQATGNASGTELSGYGLPRWYAGARSKGIAKTCVNIQSYSNIGGPYQSRFDSCPLSSIKSGKSVTVKITFNADWNKNKSSSMSLIVGRTSGHDLNSAIDNSTSISMSDNSSASSTYIPTLRTVTVSNFTNALSIAWKTNGKNGTMFNYEDLYIDNIKVSIAQ